VILSFFRTNWLAMWLTMLFGAVAAYLTLSIIAGDGGPFLIQWVTLAPLLIYFFINSYLTERTSV
jgi:hypothetical protein